MTLLLALILAVTPVWTITPVDVGSAALNGITTAADEAWSPGFTIIASADGSLTFGPLIQHWDGHAWHTVVSTADNGRLNAIDAVSRNDI
jgi:hypothetical protein